jgi:ABC-type branched-subunit amino acid transport system ATPase component/ABC-type branched-subunit amino acid transport system permease subunit
VSVLAFAWNSQVAFDGLVAGLVFGLLAMGIVLVYRATRVINFAVGNMGLVGTSLFALLTAQYHLPYWLAVAVAVLVGTAYGALVELAVVRRLFDAPRVIVLVATIGIAQLSLAIITGFPEIDEAGARFAQAIGAEHELGSIRVTGPQLTTLLVVPVVALALTWLLNRTAVGKSVKASAENRKLARLSGINPKSVSLLVWAIAGGLSTITISLIASQAGAAANLSSLGPSTLVRALVAAVIARMTSFGRAFVAGIAMGVAEGLVRFNYLDQPGLIDGVLLVIVLVAVYLQSRQGGEETQIFSYSSRRRPIPTRLAARWWVRHLDGLALGLLGLAAVVLPLVVTQTSRHSLYTTILVFALCGLSLTVLTGWGGQLSLGQMAFAGIGGLLTAGFNRGVNVDVGVGDTRFKAGIEALTFAPSLVLATLVTAAVAAVIGLGALRIRGLLLAVTTFAFGLAASQYLYKRPILRGDFATQVPLRRTNFLGLDLVDQRTYYWFVLAVVALVVVTVSRLRATGVGRTTIAVRDNPGTASAYTVGPTRVKLRAFALAGGIAALGGGLLSASLQAVPTELFFSVEDSLLLVSVVVIGGLGSVAGPILGALWVIGLPSFFPGNDIVPLLTSSIGLLVLLLYLPGGLVQVVYGVRDALLDALERRLDPATEPAARPAIASLTRRERPAEVVDGPVLEAKDVSVRFGGIQAVDGVTMHVGRREVVGLIGTNGAGKSTLMNAIGGYVPASGEVRLFGQDVSSKSPSTRAGLGFGRTFQAAALFPELSVRETVEVALEARHRSGLVATALWLPPATRRERARRREAEEILDFLGLGIYADTPIRSLSTGTRRIVELAGLLAVDPDVLCLDEPTAGLAQRETEAFGPLIQGLAAELDATVLIIEHDMPLIMGISDRVYCLELGRIIAEGVPDEVRNDLRVIASYLGTDERAIARSGAAANQ